MVLLATARVGPNFSFADYEMRRHGRKDYGFYLTSGWDGSSAIQRYHCSYPKAQQQFKLWLITQRILW